MVKYSKFYYNTRYIFPLLIGMIVGFAFSLLCTPFYDCDNRISFDLFGRDKNFSKLNLMKLKHLRSHEEQQRLDIIEQEHQKQIDEFEPRINLKGKPKKPQKSLQKLIRPRYASVELKIKYKLFVGIISTTRQLTGFASFMNRTISQYAQKVTFFVNNAEMNEKILLETTPPGVNVVNFNDDRDNLLPFHSLKYVIDNYIDQYDWFFFVTDNTYISGSKLLNLVNHMSISQDIYMGYSSKEEQSVYCSISTGILFSNTILIKLSSKMEWCTKNSYSEDPTDNIGRCVLHSTNLGCIQSANGRNVSFHSNANFNFDNEIDQLMTTAQFNNSITVYRIKDLETMKKLQLYFDQVEMDEIDAEILKIEKNILETVCYTPEGCDSLVWPLGVPSPYKPKTRHEIIRYDYFNHTHIFLGGDFDVVNELTENYKQDVEEVINFSMENLNKLINNKYVFRRLLNGYKQFDPTRGSSYVLDILLFDSLQGIEVHKRVNVMRSLGSIEIIPMPYVTESSKINLIVSFTPDYNYQNIIDFFQTYEQYILDIKEIAEKINLFVVYVRTGEDFESDLKMKEKRYISFINETIKELSKKYSSIIKTNSRIIQAEVVISNLTLYYSDSYRQLTVAEYISKKVSSDGLILMISPCSEIQIEFLNRVRLNTIRNYQVFFPIPFNEYMPNIIYPMRPFPDEVEINKNVGYFNTFTYEYVSFYNSDYLSIKKEVLSNLKSDKALNESLVNLADYANDLYDLFSTNKNLNILRATDQALKCRWHFSENCEKKQGSNNEKLRCLRQKETGLGTKAQLAMHLMKNFNYLTRN